MTSPASGYRLMWMAVLFDLPVMTKKERREATRFRKFLLDEGFQMTQFSVYLRFCTGREQLDQRVKKISQNLPSTGQVHILAFTDRQYEAMICFDGRKREPKRRNPEQFELF